MQLLSALICRTKLKNRFRALPKSAGRLHDLGPSISHGCETVGGPSGSHLELYGGMLLGVPLRKPVAELPHGLGAADAKRRASHRKTSQCDECERHKKKDTRLHEGSDAP